MMAGILQKLTLTRSLTTDDVVHRIVSNRAKYELRNIDRVQKEKEYKETCQYVAEL